MYDGGSIKRVGIMPQDEEAEIDDRSYNERAQEG
jgi:hypothetical protein